MDNIGVIVLFIFLYFVFLMVSWFYIAFFVFMLPAIFITTKFWYKVIVYLFEEKI